MAPPNTKKATEEKDLGNKHYSNKEYNKAIECYSRAIQLDPGQHTYYTNRSAAYYALGNWEASLKDARDSLNLKPDWSKGHYRAGIALSKLKRWDEAYNSLDLALKYDPESDEIKRCRTEADKERRKPKTVDANGRPLPEWQVAKEEGNYHYKEGHFNKAIESYTRGLERTDNPKEKATLLANRAACYLQQECQDYKACIRDCSDALELDPNNGKVLTRRAQSYEALEKYKLALEDFRAAVAADPTNMRASEGVHRVSRCLN